MNRSLFAIVVAALLPGACRPNPQATVQGGASDAAPPVAIDASVPPPASAGPAGSNDAPAPAGSIRLPVPPDVRVEIPGGSPKAAAPPLSFHAQVHVGQTFGILIGTPDPNDWLDAWEVESCMMGEEKTTHCPLGDPLTILNRDADPTLPQSVPPTPRREIMWKISADKIGTYVIKLRYVHRTMRTDPGRPTRRAQVAVAVVD